MIEKLKLGDWNARQAELQEDGSVIYTIEKRGEGKAYRFCVKDLYGEHEEILWEEEIIG